MATRSLTDREQAEARRVFQASLMCSRVEISDGLGAGDRPWTSCGLWIYTIHLGPRGFADALVDDNMRRTFIHELTHVWQGQNSTFGFGFMFGSVCAQGKSLVVTTLTSPSGPSTAAAYDYVAGKDWGDYNCEQQAGIVEDWYSRGLSSSDTLYPYIRECVWRGKA